MIEDEYYFIGMAMSRMGMLLLIKIVDIMWGMVYEYNGMYV